jgi:uncharacterized RDD family membrane protein YckC
MVPVLGLITWALTTVLAVGAAAAMLRAMLRREHPAKPPAAAPAAAASATAAGQAAAAAKSAALEARDSRSWEGTPQGSEPQALAPSAEGSGGGEPEPAGSPERQPLRDVPVEGRTAPPPALPGTLLTYPRATFLDRVAAFALDCILVAIAVQVLDLFRHGSFPLVLFIYHLGFWAWKGTTLGGIVVGLRVIRTEGSSLRFVDALVRGLGSILSLAALGIGCFWMLQDADRQMWHDKIAGTFVMKVPREVALA